MALYFSSDVVKSIHDVVINNGGTRGVQSFGLVESCINYPFTDVYGYQVHPHLFLRAGALLYAFTVFHPFTDGNKRTALLTTTLFLYLNGYNLKYPYDEDVINFMLSIAQGKIKSINKISKWLKNNCVKNNLFGIREEQIISMLQNRHFQILDEEIVLKINKV